VSDETVEGKSLAEFEWIEQQDVLIMEEEGRRKARRNFKINVSGSEYVVTLWEFAVMVVASDILGKCCYIPDGPNHDKRRRSTESGSPAHPPVPPTLLSTPFRTSKNSKWRESNYNSGLGPTLQASLCPVERGLLVDLRN